MQTHKRRGSTTFRNGRTTRNALPSASADIFHRSATRSSFSSWTTLTASILITSLPPSSYRYGSLTRARRSSSYRCATRLIRRENQMMTGGYQQLAGAEAFLKYLQEEFDKLRAAFSEFGSERSGSSFVIKQIQNAIGYFKNPVLGSANRQ